jgi:hypothetical protein
MGDRLYNMTQAEIYTKSQNINVHENCNGFMFTNVGDVIAEVNGMVIFPSPTPLTDLGDSRVIGGNKDELYTGTIKLSFRAPTAGTNPRVEIVQKFYTDKQ